jgi:hypothetical protein
MDNIKQKIEEKLSFELYNVKEDILKEFNHTISKSTKEMVQKILDNYKLNKLNKEKDQLR